MAPVRVEEAVASKPVEEEPKSVEETPKPTEDIAAPAPLVDSIPVEVEPPKVVEIVAEKPTEVLNDNAPPSAAVEAAEASVEPQIRYKPGPRSRKHKLVVKGNRERI